MRKLNGSRFLILLVVLVGGTALNLIPISSTAPQAVNLVDAFPGITFNTPVAIANAGDGRCSSKRFADNHATIR